MLNPCAEPGRPRGLLAVSVLSAPRLDGGHGAVSAHNPQRSPCTAAEPIRAEPGLPPGRFVLPGSLDLSQRCQAVTTSHSLEDGREARVPLTQRTVLPLWTRLSSVPRTLSGLHPRGLGSQLVRASRGFIHGRKTSQTGRWA